MASSAGNGKAIFRVVSGNFLEMFDFMVFGFYATAIAKTFFPSDSAFASLMLALATFGAGFLMRPLGAIFLGAYIDRHGRRKGLIITLALMAMGTVLIACVPGYATLASLDAGLKKLQASFGNIKRGDRYALDYNPRRGLNVERNGAVIFNSQNHELAKAYLGIWLAPEGLPDNLRLALLAQQP